MTPDLICVWSFNSQRVNVGGYPVFTLVHQDRIMGKSLVLHYYNSWDTFDLLPGERWPVDIAKDKLYEFRPQVLRDRHTGQLAGFSNP
jgi:hypothetical protein